MNLVAFLVESIDLGLISKSADLAPDLTDLGQRAEAESLSPFLDWRDREVGEIPHGEIKQHEGKHDCCGRSQASERRGSEGASESERDGHFTRLHSRSTSKPQVHTNCFISWMDFASISNFFSVIHPVVGC